MTVRESLAAALRERLKAVADREHYQRDPVGHLERLKEISARVEALAAQLEDEASPRLAHFLERRSYDKALAWLEGASE
jgi:predicted esterase